MGKKDRGPGSAKRSIRQHKKANNLASIGQNTSEIRSRIRNNVVNTVEQDTPRYSALSTAQCMMDAERPTT